MSTSSGFPKPANAAEAEAAEQVVAAYYLERIDAAIAVMTGPEAQAFQDKIVELLADTLPKGTSAAANLPNVAVWFSDVRRGLTADRAKLDVIVNPPTPSTPDEAEA